MRTLAFLTIVGLLAVPALADWEPGDGHKMHFPQMPDFNGWDVAATVTGDASDEVRRHVADDWQCSETGPVEGIHFWGSWKHEDEGTIDYFYISIWLDDPAGPGGYFDDNPYSMPLYRQPDGTLGEVWYFGVYPGEFTSRLYGTGNQGWYDPHDGTVFPPGDHFSVYQYNVDCSWLPNPFIQEEGQIYWLMIQAETSEGTEWGWKTSLDHWNDDATYFDTYTTVPPGYPHSGWTDLPDWFDLFDPESGDSLDMAFVITGPEGPGDEYVFEFSQDIGADTELSDPFMDGDEAFDPGDVYHWQSAPVDPPGRDGFKDDEGIFGIDPWPDPPDPNLVTAVPVGESSIEEYWEYFDLDGHDQIDLWLEDVDYPYPYDASSQCIWETYYLLISFDDDKRPGWPQPYGDVPVTASSPAGNTYGTTSGKDEILGVNLIPTGGPPPYAVDVVYPFADEVTVHGSLAPNPDADEDEDDDVDSLDIVRTENVCPYWYFSPDHEAHLGLDPGGIYLPIAGGYIQVIDEAFHLGLWESTDIDAFEFVWLQDPDEPGDLYLALLFSVDDDDPLTAEDESGTLSPGMIYASYMTGWSFQLLESDEGLGDDVDALTAWHTALGGCPNPGDSGNFCTADCFPNDGDGVWDYTVDGDCIVNIQDLAQLLGNYGTTTGATREDGDVFPPGYGDGAVNIQDLAELLGQYGDDCN